MWWVASLDDATQARLLHRFVLLAKEPPDSRAFDHWLRDYEQGAEPAETLA